MPDNSRRPRNLQPEEDSGDPPFLDEQILFHVFKSQNWDPHLLCQAACVSQKLRAIAKRVLWRELCYSRARTMVEALMNGSPGGRVCGGWGALAKLFFHLRVLVEPAFPGESRASGALRGDVAVLEDVGEELPGAEVLGRPAVRERPVRARDGAGGGGRCGGLSGGVQRVREVAHARVPHQAGRGVGGAGAVPLLRRARVEHDSGAAGAAQRVQEAGVP